MVELRTVHMQTSAVLSKSDTSGPPLKGIHHSAAPSAYCLYAAACNNAGYSQMACCNYPKLCIPTCGIC